MYTNAFYSTVGTHWQKRRARAPGGGNLRSGVLFWGGERRVNNDVNNNILETAINHSNFSLFLIGPKPQANSSNCTTRMNSAFVYDVKNCADFRDCYLRDKSLPDLHNSSHLTQPH